MFTEKANLSNLRLNCIEFWAKAKFLGFLRQNIITVTTILLIMYLCIQK